MKSKKITLNIFQNEAQSPYQYWREVQRNQLGISANIFFTFSSAILWAVLNYFLSKEVNQPLNCCLFLAITSNVFLFLSIIFYAFFTFNRLLDFRKTAKLYKKGYSTLKVENDTRRSGEITWILYYAQIISMVIGVIFSLILFFKLAYL